MPPLLNIAVRAARRAADLIVRSLNRLDSLEVSSKGRNDFVSEVDKMAEADIIATVRRAYPDHAFLGEESGAIPATGDGGAGDTVEWIIDPLDGTTNFLHGFPHFSVSIGCRVRGRMEHGVIYDPMRQELFTASRGGGAHLENRRLRVGNLRGLEGALLGCCQRPLLGHQVAGRSSGRRIGGVRLGAGATAGVDDQPGPADLAHGVEAA